VQVLPGYRRLADTTEIASVPARPVGIRAFRWSVASGLVAAALVGFVRRLGVLNGGEKGDRTLDLHVANVLLYC
jgi:hypothetical protein